MKFAFLLSLMTTSILAVYDLVDYSTTTIFSLSNDRLQEACVRERGGRYRCDERLTSFHKFRQGQWNSYAYWNVSFEKVKEEIVTEVVFNQVFEVSSLLLSFKRAENFSAGVVEIFDRSRAVYSGYFATSDVLCEFYFPYHNYWCKIKPNFDGISIQFPKPFRAEKLVVRLFPPNHYNNTRGNSVYLINQLFVGGKCHCLYGNSYRSKHCSVAADESNGIVKKTLVCPSDRFRFYHLNYFYSKAFTASCLCSREGTEDGLCQPRKGQRCVCKSNFGGMFCEKCAPGFYGYPHCRECSCNIEGSVSRDCHPVSGHCECLQHIAGNNCDQCAPGSYSFPMCKACQCPSELTTEGICDQQNGACLCTKRYMGVQCDRCNKWLENYPICHRPGCKCSTVGSVDGTCDDQRRCYCKPQFTGAQCRQCSPGHAVYPFCLPCPCNAEGSLNVTDCDPVTSACQCKPGFAGLKCDRCVFEKQSFPVCHTTSTCECSTKGTLLDFKRAGPCTEKSHTVYRHISRPSQLLHKLTGQSVTFPLYKSKHKNETANNVGIQRIVRPPRRSLVSLVATQMKVSCSCKANVAGADCSRCHENFYNLTAENPTGCVSCGCHETGTFAKLMSCRNTTGECACKPTVEGRTCGTCKAGFRNLNAKNLLGCTACNCNMGGSVNRTCTESGACACKENVHGERCDRLREGDYYVSDYYHLKFEVEKGRAEGGESVLMSYDAKEFANYSGRGYVAFAEKKTDLKLSIEVPRTRKYQIVFSYVLKQNESATLLVKLMNREKELSYAATVEFTPSRTPALKNLLTSKNVKEFVLTQDTWTIDMTSSTTKLLLDYLVLIPEEYCTANLIEPDYTLPCSIDQSTAVTCLMYKYIDLQSRFQLVQAETGTDHNGYGNNKGLSTRLYDNKIILEQLPVINQMAVLSRDQIALTLNFVPMETGSFYVVITYLNPDPHSYRLDMYEVSSGKRGQIYAEPCSFTFLCRLVFLSASSRSNGSPVHLSLKEGVAAELTFIGNIRGTLAIDYITLVPVHAWSVDLVIPRKLYYKRNGRQLKNEQFSTPDQAVRVKPTKDNPFNLLTNAVYIIPERAFTFSVDVFKHGHYTLILQYYQPNLPSFPVAVEMICGQQNVTMVTAHVEHCPSRSGCRLHVLDASVTGDVVVKVQLHAGMEMWVDSMFLIASDQYNEEILQPKRTELTQKFQRSCVGKDGLPLLNPPEGFCQQALFTLTTAFTGRTNKCACDSRGAVNGQCNRIGGQCQCKKGVVGRTCDKCMTGHYGFPRCKPCNCFQLGSVKADCDRYGHCTCKDRYHGKHCNRCKKGHWGFPVCRVCECDTRGSFSLRCRNFDGQCSCVSRFGGKNCNRCMIGFYNFPTCQSCNCQAAGILTSSANPTGCYSQNPNRCDCKANVEGSRCDTCRDQYYGMSVENPTGCSHCNCSSFGTVQGAGACDKESGQCRCQPNVEGQKCDQCTNGWTRANKGGIFSCKPCFCSIGGSADGVCDKVTGQCKCKPLVSGLKCDRPAPGGHYLPPIGQHAFSGAQIVPYALWEDLGYLDGVRVNASFATATMTLEIKESDSFYIMIHYAFVHTNRNVEMEFEFTNNDKAQPGLFHRFVPKKTERAHIDLVKDGLENYRLNLTKGVWKMQIFLYETFLLNQVTIVPVKHFTRFKISRTIKNPCTLSDNKKYCSLYTYQTLRKARVLVIEGDDLIMGGEKVVLNKTLYNRDSTNRNTAIRISNTTFIPHLQPGSANRLHLVVQYLNLNETTTLDVTMTTDYGKQTGRVELPPCIYSFGCRKVVSDLNGVRTTFDKGYMKKYFTLKLKNGSSVYIDFLAMVPASEWLANYITPAFYCSQKQGRCMKNSFPAIENTLEAETSREVSLSNTRPPNAQRETKAVLISQRTQHTLRFVHPMLGIYAFVIHYFQPHYDDFHAKVVLTTHQSAMSGKVSFKYCPSIYGCRAVVHRWDDPSTPRAMFLSGSIIGFYFTLPKYAKVWVDKVSIISPEELQLNKSLLDVHPLDLSRRYLRKCAGRRDKYVKSNYRAFCRTATFELTLGLNIRPRACSCNSAGSVEINACDTFDGQCACKAGFIGRDCSRCERGVFPFCLQNNKYAG